MEPIDVAHTQTADPEMVFQWRAEAERKMRETGRPGMSEDEVRDFCSRYMPAYRAYLPGLYNAMDSRQGASRVGVGVIASGKGEEASTAPGVLGESEIGLREKPALVVEVGRDRNPVDVDTAAPDEVVGR